jgi:hypothetical protein
MYAVPEPAILQSPPHFFGGGLGRGRFNCQCLIVNCQCRFHDARIVSNHREYIVTEGLHRKSNLLLLLISTGIEIFYMQRIMYEILKKYASCSQ